MEIKYSKRKFEKKNSRQEMAQVLKFWNTNFHTFIDENVPKFQKCALGFFIKLEMNESH